MNIYQPIQWDNSIREKHYKNMIEYVLKQFDKQAKPEVIITEDADFEIIDPKTAVFDIKKIQDRMKELGQLEDINHEIIQPKQLT